jgi:hypothetical protein
MKSAPQALFGWRRGVAYAALLGLVMGALEGVAPAAVAEPGAAALRVFSPLVGWVFGAALIVGATAWAVPRLSIRALLPITLAVVVVFTAIRVATPVPVLGREGLQWVYTTYPTLSASSWYLGWGLMLYSAMFVGASALAFRADRTRGLLAQAEIARGRSETLFAEAQLSGLQGIVDPVFVLRALGEMQRRYATEPAGADRLLDQLVAFLRLAMPAVRSGRSTLGAELALAHSSINLCKTLEPKRAEWVCDIDPALDHLPFPPLLLLPLLDALSAGALGHGAALRLTAQREGANARLALHGAAAPGWLPGTLLHRLRVGLQALHGAEADVTLQADTHADHVELAALTITVPSATTAHPPDPKTPGGTSP